MASDQLIAESVDTLLRETTPGTLTSLNDVVHLLQSRLGFDLSHKIDLIRSRVSSFYSVLRHQIPPLPPQTTIYTPSQYPQHQFHYPVHPHPHHHQGPVFRNATEISFSQPHSLKPNVAVADPPVAKEASQSRPKRRGGAGGLNKLCGCTPELQTIVGQPCMTRTEIVKQLWVYIRKNNLQDPSNKRKIICNDDLRLLFETDATDMFQMNKLLSKHILPLNPPKETGGPQAKKVKVDDEREVKNTESNPVILSEALANFFGESGKEMPQDEALKRILEYVREQGLEDASKSLIMCDAKLQELLGCESIPAAGIYEVLTRNHFIQKS